jgi:hypothetical protein
VPGDEQRDSGQKSGIRCGNGEAIIKRGENNEADKLSMFFSITLLASCPPLLNPKMN